MAGVMIQDWACEVARVVVECDVRGPAVLQQINGGINFDEF